MNASWCGRLLDVCAGAVIGAASCQEGDWSCEQGVPAIACDFPCGLDPIPCTLSCETFELFDATCVQGDWSCGDGMLAADC